MEQNMKCLSNKAAGSYISGIPDVSGSNSYYQCPKGYKWQKELVAALLISMAILVFTIVIVLVFIPLEEKMKMRQIVASSLNSLSTIEANTDYFDIGKMP